MVKKRIFAPFFTVQEEEWECGKDEDDETITLVKPISYCNNIRSFLTYVKEDRNIEGTKVKISLDKGIGSLKFTCSLFNPDSEDQTQDFLLGKPLKKRQKKLNFFNLGLTPPPPYYPKS